MSEAEHDDSAPDASATEPYVAARTERQRIFVTPFLRGFFVCGPGRCCVFPKSSVGSLLLLVVLFQVVIVPFMLLMSGNTPLQIACMVLFGCGVVPALILSNSVDPGIVPSARIGTAMPQPQPYTCESGEVVTLPVCETCLIVRPARSSHHSTACVTRSDHHCSTTGAQVSARNMRFFTLSLFMMWLLLLFLSVSSIVVAATDKPAQKSSEAAGGSVRNSGLIFVAVLSGITCLALTGMLKAYLYDYAAKALTAKDCGSGSVQFVNRKARKAKCETLCDTLCTWPLVPPSIVAQLTDEELADAQGDYLV